MKPLIKELSKSLLEWYKANHRDLPWRSSRDPYRIWISEVMLQQTTVVAVIPFYERFLTRFPDVHILAKAPSEDVLEAWAGLGYYSRARNLHKASQQISENGFPKKAAELLELSGFGPYTSRAVASLAFDEAVGVLDGNVIRVLSRVLGISSKWWTTKDREHLQKISDDIAQHGPPHLMNQGLMELGATVCTPHSPACLLCPWSKVCVAREENKISKLPLKKPRKSSEVWIWKPVVLKQKGKLALVKNNYVPFLKGQLIFPGSAKKALLKPMKYDVKHSITHHDIYIVIQDSLQSKDPQKKALQWVMEKELKKINPSSMLQKILQKK